MGNYFSKCIFLLFLYFNRYLKEKVLRINVNLKYIIFMNMVVGFDFQVLFIYQEVYGDVIRSRENFICFWMFNMSMSVGLNLKKRYLRYLREIVFFMK